MSSPIITKVIMLLILSTALFRLSLVFVRVFMPSPSGRNHFNGLGAINALSLEIITVTNETYINAESVCQLLEKLSDLALKIPITLVWDNARYQKCAAVFESQYPGSHVFE
ncbi:MAG: hypothetical protein HC769_29370 [Cyanobacteria bacterium CRU_2_1]|nr:hypothetical protein [Cyanobacteria bacterium RU_5_0]NJR62549.1 hypothetical protein [Cyanobacteria bacterium CRU_2_1]